ncbi:winged helix-turn-helix domain-containing protein [Salarchaeum japonicum]|uniref:Winged helix-turn-helix domain-containing protein n=2 Tax=Salarchaeum japonicum TaxID=555573 RepID=A0AAV3SZP2_9EURY
MRYSGDYMNIWDDRILEILEDEGPLPVGKLANHKAIHTSKSTISRRCRKLAEKGLLQKIGNGVYSISDIGLAYLDGEYDAEAEEFIEDPSTYDFESSEQEANGA